MSSKTLRQIFAQYNWSAFLWFCHCVCVLDSVFSHFHFSHFEGQTSHCCTLIHAVYRRVNTHLHCLLASTKNVRRRKIEQKLPRCTKKMFVFFYSNTPCLPFRSFYHAHNATYQNSYHLEIEIERVVKGGKSTSSTRPKKGNTIVEWRNSLNSLQRGCIHFGAITRQSFIVVCIRQFTTQLNGIEKISFAAKLNTKCKQISCIFPPCIRNNKLNCLFLLLSAMHTHVCCTVLGCTFDRR